MKVVYWVLKMVEPKVASKVYLKVESKVVLKVDSMADTMES